MKYLVRAVKYFFYFSILVALIITALVLIGFVEGGIDSIFRDGYSAIWQIAVLFALVAAIYPKLGFIEKQAEIRGEYSEIRDKVVEYMDMRGYSLESEEGENMTFRLRSKLNALTRMFEDRITMTRCLGGFGVEGLTKDVIRVISGLEYAFREEEEEDTNN